GYEVIEATFGRPVPEALKCAIWDAFSEPHNWALLPGAAEVCALPVAKAVLSNMDSRLYGILSGLQLGPIDFVVLPGEAGRPKPNEAMMQLACGFLRVAPEDVLHIGDSAADDGGMCQRTGATWLRVDPAGGPDLHAIRTAFAL
ncbi:MAG: FMN phosphatase YigB (HAD superfamily), partial [Myxococcota bacterium]